MSTEDSVSQWIDGLKQGEDELAGIFGIATSLSSFTSLASACVLKVIPSRTKKTWRSAFWRASSQLPKNDRFPNLKDRDGLWRLLSEMTRRKAIDYLRRSQRLKRGGGRVAEDAVSADEESRQHAVGQVPGGDPTPEIALMLAEECGALLEQLDEELQRLALRKLEGYTNKEIAAELGCSVATVERRLQLIRKKWQRELA